MNTLMRLQNLYLRQALKLKNNLLIGEN